MEARPGAHGGILPDIGADFGSHIGPLEQHHMPSATFRNAADTTRITCTHWHIAAANGLGWGFDGMDGVIFAIVTPYVIKEFAIDLGTFRSGVQIAMGLGIIGLYFWPWIATRNMRAVNWMRFRSEQA